MVILSPAPARFTNARLRARSNLIIALPALLLVAALDGCAAAEGNVLVSRNKREPAPLDGGLGTELDATDRDATDRDAAGRDTAAADATALDAQPPLPSSDAGTPDTRGVCRIGGSKDGFYENFSGSTLDPTRWLLAHGPISFGRSSARGGFARDNVQLLDGSLRLRVRGDRYEGDVRSVDAAGKPAVTGKRSAAAIVTRDLFGSGTYQMQGSFAGPASVEVALWYLRDDDSGGAIDLSTPGRNGSERSYGFVRMRTRDAISASDTQFALGDSLDDGASHILRFDWYTTAMSSVTFWIDDALRSKSTRALPPMAAGRLWIVAWVPDDLPADFDTAEIRIDNAFITPFGNNGDTCVEGELAGPFLTLP
jgi:hypothetical protein